VIADAVLVVSRLAETAEQFSEGAGAVTETVFPQIFVDGDPIGGYTELWQLDRSGQLDKLAA